MQVWQSALMVIPMQAFEAHCALQGEPAMQPQVCRMLGMTLFLPLIARS